MWPVFKRAIDYFDTIPPLLLVILAVVAAIRPRRDYVVYYVCCQFIFNGYANLLNELKQDNLYVYALNFTWSYYLLSLYFTTVYASPALTKILMGIAILVQIDAFVNIQSATTEITFNSISFGVISLLITFYCFLYYARQLSVQPKANILDVPDFWYVNGIFTYYASNFFIFLTYNTLTSRNYANIGIIWRIHNVIFLVMCIYFFIGLRCRNLPEESKLSL